MSDEDDKKPKTVTAGPAKHLFPVKLAADPDGAPGDAPEDLEVLLSVPTTKQNEVNFEKFKVVAGTKQQFLVAVDPPAKPTITAATRRPLWCAWGKTALTAPSVYDKVPGFGYPLLARFRGNTLVLPNYRNLTLRCHNLTGQPHSAAAPQAVIAGDLSAATKFYDALHIRLVVEPGTPPSKVQGAHAVAYQSPEEKNGNVEKADVVVIIPKSSKTYTPPLDFGGSDWGALSAPSKTVLVCWVEELWNMGRTGGFAFSKSRFSGGFLFSIGEVFKKSSAPMVFLPRVTTTTMDQRLAHELGHVLLYDLGAGKVKIEKMHNEVAVTAHLRALFGPGAGDRYDSLPEHPHSLAAPNLMGVSGGGELVDWQVAAMRASTLVGDGP